jgi:hypothetical protein
MAKCHPMPRILLCTFPFPEQSPPLQISHPCVQCPNADRAILDHHSKLPRDDAELQEAIRSFAKWFFDPSVTAEEMEEHLRYAADLYTREDHSGTCIPKTLLFAYYKLFQFDPDFAPAISETARAALRGEAVRSWPDGKIRGGVTWDEMFREYTARYDSPL